ncbi:helix-turn-helix transcriptional regulator [Enterobacter hormaechei]
MLEDMKKKSDELSHALELASWKELAWPDLLQIICSTLPGTVSHLIHHSPNENKSLSLNWYGIEDSIAIDYENYFIQIDPWAKKLASLSNGCIVSSEEILPAHSFRGTKFFNEHLYRMGNVLSWSGLKVNAHDVDNAFLCIHYQNINYDKKCKYLLSLIRSAFIDAVRNTIKIDKNIKKIKSETFLSYNHENICIIVDSEMNVYEVNTSAEVGLFKRGIGSLKNRKLRFRDKNTDDVFQKSVKNLSSTFLSENEVLSLRVNNIPYLASLRRIGSDGSRPLLFCKPLIAISIKEVEVNSRVIKVDLLRKLFLFTDTEAKICSLISCGYSLAEASVHACITYEHARQRMKVILQKTNTSNQLELNVLLLKIKHLMEY